MDGVPLNVKLPKYHTRLTLNFNSNLSSFPLFRYKTTQFYSFPFALSRVNGSADLTVFPRMPGNSTFFPTLKEQQRKITPIHFFKDSRIERLYFCLLGTEGVALIFGIVFIIKCSMRYIRRSL